MRAHGLRIRGVWYDVEGFGGVVCKVLESSLCRLVYVFYGIIYRVYRLVRPEGSGFGASY